MYRGTEESQMTEHIFLAWDKVGQDKLPKEEDSWVIVKDHQTSQLERQVWGVKRGSNFRERGIINYDWRKEYCRGEKKEKKRLE